MELSLPAGSLESGIAAFKGGADSVYLGMKDFSARKKAQNFSFEDLSRLKAMASSLGRRIYVTINTIIFEEELESVFKVLRQLSFLRIDGVIIQDLALANLVHKFFPDLELHGSTQLAVHNAEGVRMLQKLGFTRVVLARELSFSEIQSIRTQCPDIELKVFIHGAMCYGFSGLCEASRLITGRSANRGECAQICRTYFTCQETHNDGFFFSMKDLEIGEGIRELKKIGVDSVKVEGRMKGPQYTFSVARYYSLLLDPDADHEEISNAKVAMETSFLRESSDGYFSGKSRLICPDYPQHRGIQAGHIVKVTKTQIGISLIHPVAIRDGLLIISPDVKKPSAKFSLMDIETREGRHTSYANAGQIIYTTAPADFKPQEGQKVYLISLHNQNISTVKTESLPLFKRPTDVLFRVFSDKLSLQAIVGERTIEEEFELQMQEASSPSDFKQIIRDTFKASANSFFTLGEAVFDLSSCPFTNIFAPISALKQIRRTWYSILDAEASALLSSQAPQLLKKIDKKRRFITLPKRSELGLWDEISQIDGVSYCPLCPVIDDERTLEETLEKITGENPDVIIGLNNIAHVHWALSHPETKVFLDVYLYIANPLSAEEYSLPNLVGAYFFMEDSAQNRDFSTWPWIPTDASDFKPPLFISRACFSHHSLGKSCETCTGMKYSLVQNDKHYTVRTKGCLTVVSDRT